ncbi:predicted protein [Nematostella vectensis]|uniref:E3 ubiquitin-protein ligase RNF144B n=1 Tax=Nematostella vectensis TaxID=45351 RepID=A7SFQ2_NEMVE|nr:probable E3 ubiquitin-protein ligase RNF144A-A [Nematostella vectensis]XP_032233702.1 probable E3 ubiquitin-protein ligase RNF144A-A [Nematostella vectensis]XP_032233703.1 probable E3 ubiquitin-protein ligase RNF144A-A [Nematostella vectensis]EDO37437.1 predicted protein [Nematostella vectensis]|eukprot:XP_001629500.1 predicted protein [Nematostella vectensis]
MAPAVTKTVVQEGSLRHRPKTLYCKICLADCPTKKGAILKSCGCFFCKECLKQYVAHAIADGSVLQIPCPDGVCPDKGDLMESEIADLIAEDLFQNFQKMRAIKEIQISKSKAFCPKPDCKGVVESIPGAAKEVCCSECGYSFCFACKGPWHPEKHCQNKGEKANGIKFFELVNGEEVLVEIKACPTCQVLIQRDEGCAQMMCGNCKHIFCWHCLKGLDSDILLRHYDKGPCRDKLGHSRTTLLLHRTQVVAGFVFFGAMIVIASPFLLVISPCFLLSKCLFRNKKEKSQ